VSNDGHAAVCNWLEEDEFDCAWWYNILPGFHCARGAAGTPVAGRLKAKQKSESLDRWLV